jgi:nitrogen fixation protein FixH
MLPEAGVGFRLTGRHVLIALLTFFGIVIAVNAAFVHIALSSWTGLTDHDSYRTGLSWNRTLERDAAQTALGWTSDVATRVVLGADGDRSLGVSLTLRDSAGRPVRGLAFTGEARHPVIEADDRMLEFSESAPGVYVATAVLPGAGDWELKLTAKRPDGTDFRIDTVATVR